MSRIVWSPNTATARLIRELGFRRCYRRADTHHGVENKSCDCLRVELPVGARAKSFGALATPDRNHTCPQCGGLGEVSIYPCTLCLGSGELKVDRSPAKPALSDRAVRERLSTDRRAGKLGVR